MKKTLACLVLVLALVATSTAAHAYHDENTPTTDGTPYTLGKNNWRIGLWKLEYGGPLSGKLQLGTWTAYWLPWAVGAHLVNFNVKYNLWSNDRWSFAAGLGLFYLDIENLVDTPVSFTVVPFDLYAAYRLSPRFTLGARLIATGLSGEGAYDRDEIDGAQGAVAASSSQFALSVIWRLTRVIAFESEWRVGRYVEVYGAGKATFAIDEQTEVDVFGETTADLSDNTLSSLAARFHFSWKYVNLRLGLVLGNYTIAGINFIVPTRIPFPELDLFVRF